MGFYQERNKGKNETGQLALETNNKKIKNRVVLVKTVMNERMKQINHIDLYIGNKHDKHDKKTGLVWGKNDGILIRQKYTKESNK